jgi:hypothetical protein
MKLRFKSCMKSGHLTDEVAITDEIEVGSVML